MAAPKGNKNAIGNNGGRPPLYSNGEQLAEKCTDYFEYVKGEYEEKTKIVTDKESGTTSEEAYKEWIRHPEPLTVTGLTLFLGFSDKSSLYDYAKKDFEFSHPIKRALTRIEQSHEFGLNSRNPTGHIFALKNSGWTDKQQIEHSGDEEKPLKIIQIGTSKKKDNKD